MRKQGQLSNIVYGKIINHRFANIKYIIFTEDLYKFYCMLMLKKEGRTLKTTTDQDNQAHLKTSVAW